MEQNELDLLAALDQLEAYDFFAMAKAVDELSDEDLEESAITLKNELEEILKEILEYSRNVKIGEDELLMSDEAWAKIPNGIRYRMYGGLIGVMRSYIQGLNNFLQNE